MSRIRLFLFTLFFAIGLSKVAVLAQNSVFVGGGLNIGYSSPDSLNRIISSFNSENPDFNHPMGNVSLPMGIHGTLGGKLGGLLVDISYTMRMQGVRAKNNSASIVDFQRHLRYSSNTVDIGFGYFVVNTPGLQIAPGISMDMGQFRIRYRGGSVPYVNTQPWAVMVNELSFGASAFVQIMIPFGEGMGPGIFIRPYYQFGLVQHDFGQINRVLRPVEALDDEFYLLDGVNIVGIKMGMVLFSN